MLKQKEKSNENDAYKNVQHGETNTRNKRIQKNKTRAIICLRELEAVERPSKVTERYKRVCCFCQLILLCRASK